MRRLTERQSSLSSEASSFQASPAEDEMATIQALLAEADLAKDTVEQQRIANAEQIEILRHDDKLVVEELNVARSQQQTLKGRQASLEALQQAAKGDNTEQQWLDAKGLGDKPRLADSVVPEAGWEIAVETVLGSYLQAIAVDDIASTVSLLEDFSKGELLLVGNNSTAPVSGSAGKLLSDLVSGCLLYTSPSPRDRTRSRMPSSA